MPATVATKKDLEEILRLQDKAAQTMKKLRHVHGKLGFETVEVRPVFDGHGLRDLEVEKKNRARGIIEDFMMANGVITWYLSSKHFPLIRRVVFTPKRWARIVELDEERGSKLPNAPDSKALEEFLTKEKAADQVGFPSLAVIKLMGGGEYVAELPGETVQVHFGFAVSDYTHSTAPNRRYADLITQRLLNAIGASSLPYGNDELASRAKHCMEEEDAANKVERQVRKSVAAMLLEHRIGGAILCHSYRRSGERHLGSASYEQCQRENGPRFRGP